MLTHEQLWDIASNNQPCKEPTTGTEYNVTRYDDTIVIAFESTRDALDWKQNFSGSAIINKDRVFTLYLLVLVVLFIFSFSSELA